MARFMATYEARDKKRGFDKAEILTGLLLANDEDIIHARVGFRGQITALYWNTEVPPEDRPFHDQLKVE